MHAFLGGRGGGNELALAVANQNYLSTNIAFAISALIRASLEGGGGGRRNWP